MGCLPVLYLLEPASWELEMDASIDASIDFCSFEIRIGGCANEEGKMSRVVSDSDLDYSFPFVQGKIL